MRQIKFRGCYAQGVENAGKLVYWGINGTDVIDCVDTDTIGQWTGLFDKEGKEIYEGDLVNCFFTSGNGEHIHDCIYRVFISDLYGVELKFVSLLWENYGHNQYPFERCLRYRPQDVQRYSLDAKLQAELRV